MILIVRPKPGASHAIALFGVGLIGGAILRALMKRGVTSLADLPLNWKDRPQRSLDLLSLTHAINCQFDRAPLARLDIVWAAGKAGFGAGREELGAEFEAFRDISKWAQELPLHLPPGTSLGFHMLSSAGGLFEGQRFVDSTTLPRPHRAYGEAKLEQEATVEDLRNTMVAHIYRPSSVYGFSREGGRSGLINTLIENAKKHSVSRIFGGLDTVRDYILASDIAEFVANKITQPETASQTFLLASGKPASVSTIAQIVTKVVGSPLYLKLDVQPSNASHITFRQSALPEGWRPTDLETGIRLVARQLSLSFETGARRYLAGPTARLREG